MKKLMMLSAALAAVAGFAGTISGTWNGERLKPTEVTLSAFPLNIEWPGAQRPKDQTKKGYAVNVDLKDGIRVRNIRCHGEKPEKIGYTINNNPGPLVVKNLELESVDQVSR